MSELTPGMFVRLSNGQDTGKAKWAGGGCRATLIELQGAMAVVRPFNHRRNEMVPIEHVRPWIAGEAERVRTSIVRCDPPRRQIMPPQRPLIRVPKG